MKNFASKYSWTISGVIVLAILMMYPSQAKSTVTKWWKISPNTCAISTLGSDLDQADNADLYSDLSIQSSLSGAISISAHCPVFLPDGVTANKLRIRTFQAGGIPSYSDVTVRLRRTSWSGSTYTLATAYMSEGYTYDDYNFTTTIDNEDYEYGLHITLYKGNSATSEPELGMIEIRYEE